MRRIGLVLSSCLLVFAAACGSSSSTKPDGGGGSGGSHAGSGGSTAGSGGSGGSTAGSGGSTAGSGGSTAGTDGGTDAPSDATDGGDGGLTPIEARGSYLVGVLGCSGCHTPKTSAGAADTTKLLSGVDCFAKDPAVEAGTACLASANLTNDASGIKNISDLDLKNAFTKGIFPAVADAGTQYLFANMPYYQFATLNDADASAIVAYLRSLPPIVHTAAANGGIYATRPTAPQWASVPLTSYPTATVSTVDGGTDAASDAATDAAATDAAATPSTTSLTNGRYLAALVCSTCHTVNATGADGGVAAPLILDMAKLLQGGKEFTTTLTVLVDADAGTDGGADAGDGGSDAATTTTISKKIQSVNLTPDTTGLKAWTAAQIVQAIKAGKDEGGRTICSPMRPFPSMTDGDALDIANYLQAIPAATNAITETCE